MYSIGLPAGANAGLMLGLKEPLASTPIVAVLALLGIFSATRRLHEVALLTMTLIIAFSLSVSINLVAGHPAVFRTIIFVCAASLIHLSGESKVSRSLVYVYVIAGYFLGMNKGIALPDITCPLYYLVGLDISVGLVLSVFVLLGIAVGVEVLNLLKNRATNYLKKLW